MTRSGRLTIRLLVIGAVAVAAACGAPVPSPSSVAKVSPSAPPSPAPTVLGPTPTFTPTARRPPVDCPDPRAAGRNLAIGCEEAVTLALGAVPPDRTIERITVAYGGFCPPMARCALGSGLGAFVILSREAPRSSTLVTLGWTYHGWNVNSVQAIPMAWDYSRTATGIRSRVSHDGSGREI
jgi:hypothetical protein